MECSLDYVFYATLFLSTAGVTGSITNHPQNTVAEVGGQAIFNCTSDLVAPSWIFSKTREEVVGSTGQSIVAYCGVLPGFATDYAVDRQGGSNKSCNLIIKAATMQQAGVYTCSDTQTGPSAILTTTDRDTTITVKKQPETVEGETVTMSYTVRYNTSTASNDTPTIKPVLTWTDFDGNTVTGSPSSTANSVTSSILVTAGRQDIRPYTCHISYTSPSTKPSIASNTPNSVSNPPTTSNINVTSAKCSQDDHKMIIIACIVSYILGNIIATVVFLIYYNRNIVFKRTLNDRFPWLRKMLPCMNEDVACGCLWIFLSVCMFTLVGLVFIILMISNCCRCCSQERGRAEAPVKHFNNPSDLREQIDYPLPDYDDSYDRINIRIHSASQENTRKPDENQPPSSPPNEAPQNQQTQGPVYSDIHRNTDRSVQPQQYITATAKHFHNPRDIKDLNAIPEMDIHSSTLGPNGDDTYAKINDERHRVSQDNSKKGKDQTKQQNGKENGKPKSADKKENQSPIAPSSLPPNQQPTTAQGPVYSDLPVTDRNVQPQQYIENNMDNNYSELKKT